MLTRRIPQRSFARELQESGPVFCIPETKADPEKGFAAEGKAEQPEKPFYVIKGRRGGAERCRWQIKRGGSPMNYRAM